MRLLLPELNFLFSQRKFLKFLIQFAATMQATLCLADWPLTMCTSVELARAGKKYSSFCPVYWSRYKSNGFLGVMSHSAGEVDMSNSRKVCLVNVRSTTIRMCAKNTSWRLPLCNCTIEIWHQYFYRTQVNMGSDLWVRMSLREWDTLCRLNWCDSGWWGYQLNTNWW